MRGLGLRATTVAAAVLAVAALLGACGGEGGTGVETGPLSVTGEGPGSYRVSGEANSLQSFGKQAGASELEEAASNVHSFLGARARRDWAGACSQLSKHELGEVTLIASQQDKKLTGEDCASVIYVLLPAVPTGEVYKSSAMKAGSLRAAYGHGYLFFRNAGSRWMIPMTYEGGSWKIAAIFPNPVG